MAGFLGVVQDEVYPRACGGTQENAGRLLVLNGLSPRLRGNLCHLAQTEQSVGSIPAPAGEPYHPRQATGPDGVYPRACGGTRASAWYSVAMPGLSPRLRGNRREDVDHAARSRSIPAPAGEPILSAPSWPAHPVYPRACGGTPAPLLRRASCPGLSPRLRGNPFPHSSASIPGEVYPRACGGTLEQIPNTGGDHGLSPRLRGNPRRGTAASQRPGSIPAPAGEPQSWRRPHTPGRVYPRACGGTRPFPDSTTHEPGLSPRLRGNRLSTPDRWTQYRSIPAPAGEPAARESPESRARVYPRACGGTSPAARLTLRQSGLSPRLRGTASRPTSSRIRIGLSPRCGGTHRANTWASCPPGLSPRLRGNRMESDRRPGWNRSIPAPAGEPESLDFHVRDDGVYPRACGGTGKVRCSPLLYCGLSPRLRGNPERPDLHPHRQRSIPAPAGEPGPLSCSKSQHKVYPRACGGTGYILYPVLCVSGLSPRLRGNHHSRGPGAGPDRSIPAPAGEPPPSAAQTGNAAVYPRACGGTTA